MINWLIDLDIVLVQCVCDDVCNFVTMQHNGKTVAATVMQLSQLGRVGF